MLVIYLVIYSKTDEMFVSNYDMSPSQVLVIYLVIYSKTDEMFLSNYDMSPSQEVHLFHEITWHMPFLHSCL